MRTFTFLKYDGSTFTRYEHDVSITNHSRRAFLDGMRNGQCIRSSLDVIGLLTITSVTEVLFSIILEAYISTLDIINSRSKLHGLQGDVRSQC